MIYIIIQAGGVNIGFSLETLSTILCIYIVIFVYNWKMSLVMMVFLPLMVAVGVFQGKAIKGLSQDSNNSLKESGKVIFGYWESMFICNKLERDSKLVSTI